MSDTIFHEFLVPCESTETVLISEVILNRLSSVLSRSQIVTFCVWMRCSVSVSVSVSVTREVSIESGIDSWGGMT